MSEIVRCTTHKPSPYLKKHWKNMLLSVRPDLALSHNDTDNYVRELLHDANVKIVDLGGGNGRNSIFLQDTGFRHCTLLDKVGDYGIQWDIEKQSRLPFIDGFADIVLVNYVLMFLSNMSSVENAVDDIKRITKPGGCAMVEVQWVTTHACLARTREQAERFIQTLLGLFGWDTVNQSQYRFIVQKPWVIRSDET